jgi:hypothetical protein
MVISIDVQRETEEKARQPETKPGAIAHTRHQARLRNAQRSKTKSFYEYRLRETKEVLQVHTRRE